MKLWDLLQYQDQIYTYISILVQDLLQQFASCVLVSDWSLECNVFSLPLIKKNYQIQSIVFEKGELRWIKTYHAGETHLKHKRTELPSVVSYYDMKKMELNLSGLESMLLFVGSFCSQLCANTGRIFTTAKGNQAAVWLKLKKTVQLQLLWNKIYYWYNSAPADDFGTPYTPLN